MADSSELPPFMPPQAILRKEEIQALIGRLKSVRDSLAESQNHIISFKKGINPFATTVLPEHNIVFISPHINADFELLQETAMPYSDLISILEVWSMELATALAGNRHHLLKSKSKMLLAHHQKVLEVCRIADSVDLSLKEILKSMGI